MLQIPRVKSFSIKTEKEINTENEITKGLLDEMSNRYYTCIERIEIYV